MDGAARNRRTGNMGFGSLTVYTDAMGVNWASFQTCQDLRMIGEILFKLISAVGYLLFISELLRLRDSNDLKSVDEELSTPAEWS